MSRSRKRNPAGTCCCCKSQKKGKRFANRKFRRASKSAIKKGIDPPHKSIELTNSWDLGGDGKCFYALCRLWKDVNPDIFYRK